MQLNTETYLNHLSHLPYPYLENMHYIGQCVEDALIILDQDGMIVFSNDAAASLYSEFGYIDAIIGKRYHEISLHGAIKAGPARNQSACQFGLCGRHYALSEHFFQDYRGFYVLLIRDITERHQSNEQLLLKSVSVREAHHRIKNNLQTIQGLLSMQERRMVSQEGKAALQDAIGRINSISLSHDLLVKSESSGEEIYIQDLLGLLRNNFLSVAESDDFKLSIVLTGDDFLLEKDTCASITLILNELLQNAYKHAFPGRTSGEIELCAKDNALYPQLIVSDNGRGIPADIEKPQATDGLGMQLVRNIVKNRLKGRLNIASNPSGSVFTFDFRKCIMK